MPNRDHLRALVGRLTAGILRTDDLTSVLLWMREHTQSPELRELGDFVAHGETRQKGTVTDRLRAFFAIINLMLMKERGDDLNFEKFPSDVFILSEFCLRTFSLPELKARTGLSREKAKRSLERLKKSYKRTARIIIKLSKRYIKTT